MRSAILVVSFGTSKRTFSGVVAPTRMKTTTGFLQIVSKRQLGALETRTRRPTQISTPLRSLKL